MTRKISRKMRDFDRVARYHLSEIHSMLSGDAVVTLVVHVPGDEEADIVITSVDWNATREAANAINRRCDDEIARATGATP